MPFRQLTKPRSPNNPGTLSIWQRPLTHTELLIPRNTHYLLHWAHKIKHHIGTVNVTTLLACQNKFWKPGGILPKVFTTNLYLPPKKLLHWWKHCLQFPKKIYQLETPFKFLLNPNFGLKMVVFSQMLFCMCLWHFHALPWTNFLPFVLYVCLIQIRLNSPISLTLWKKPFQRQRDRET